MVSGFPRNKRDVKKFCTIRQMIDDYVRSRSSRDENCTLQDDYINEMCSELNFKEITSQLIYYQRNPCGNMQSEISCI